MLLSNFLYLNIFHLILMNKKISKIKIFQKKGDYSMFLKKISFILILLTLTVPMVIAQGNDFSQTDLKKALNGEKNLSEARLSNANLSGKNFSNVNFTNADLEGANLSNANLSGANFSHADLDKVNFQGANLENANFYHADLEEANLKGANIKGAKFKQAELEYTTWIDGRVCAEGSLGGCW